MVVSDNWNDKCWLNLHVWLCMYITLNHLWVSQRFHFSYDSALDSKAIYDTLNVSTPLLSMDGQRALWFNLYSEHEQRSQRIGTTWGWVTNNSIFSLGELTLNSCSLHEMQSFLAVSKVDWLKPLKISLWSPKTRKHSWRKHIFHSWNVCTVYDLLWEMEYFIYLSKSSNSGLVNIRLLHHNTDTKTQC